MKKLLIILLCQIAGYMMPTLAQNTTTTDIKNVASVLYAQEVSVNPGEQIVLPVFMKNANSVTLFQTDVYAPEGFTFAKKTNGRYAVSLNKTRLTDEDDDHAISANIQTDGALRILCSSQNNYTFDGNDGEVMSITLDVAANVAPGKYAIQLNKQKLVRPENIGDNIAQYQVEVTVKGQRYNAKYDINGDGKVTIEDVTEIIDYILEK